jgi:hypothetical protein
MTNDLMFFIGIIKETIKEAEDAIATQDLTENELHLMNGAVLGMNGSIEIMKRGNSRRMAEYMLDHIRDMENER